MMVHCLWLSLAQTNEVFEMANLPLPIRQITFPILWSSALQQNHGYGCWDCSFNRSISEAIPAYSDRTQNFFYTNTVFLKIGFSSSAAQDYFTRKKTPGSSRENRVQRGIFRLQSSSFWGSFSFFFLLSLYIFFLYSLNIFDFELVWWFSFRSLLLGKCGHWKILNHTLLYWWVPFLQFFPLCILWICTSILNVIGWNLCKERLGNVLVNLSNEGYWLCCRWGKNISLEQTCEKHCFTEVGNYSESRYGNGEMKLVPRPGEA